MESTVSTEELLCVRDAGADGSGWWIFVEVDVDIVDDSSLSSHCTSARVLVSELSRLVTHTAVSSPKMQQ